MTGGEGALSSIGGEYWGFHMPKARVLANFVVWCILSRVGDRPTATILHAQFHSFFDFCFGSSKQSIRPKYASPRGPIIH